MSKLLIVTGLTCLITLTCVGLQGYHAEPRCKNAAGSKCPDGTKDTCKDYPAVKLSENGYYTACQWRTATSVIGLLGLVVTLVFTAVVFLRLRGKDFQKHVKYLSFVSLPLLVVTIALMIADLAQGKDKVGDEEGYAPGSYIANLILTFIAIVMIVYLSLQAKKD